ncbi:MAG: FtsX-like permease family protein [Bryobacteraceae bacterium]|nr:FtsX-like permease family protein [Bryobacteraceae bacterium]
MTLQSVSRRTREFGVRIALGATAGALRRTVLRQTLTLAACGIPLGWLLSWAGRRIIEQYLFGVRPVDPWVWAFSTGLVLLTACAAALQPARRAARVDPVVALREE